MLWLWSKNFINGPLTTTNTSVNSTKICHHSSHYTLHFVCDISHSCSAGYNAHKRAQVEKNCIPPSCGVNVGWTLSASRGMPRLPTAHGWMIAWHSCVAGGYMHPRMTGEVASHNILARLPPFSAAVVRAIFCWHAPIRKWFERQGAHTVHCTVQHPSPLQRNLPRGPHLQAMLLLPPSPTKACHALRQRPHNHVSVNVSVTDTNGHMQYKSGQKHTQVITRVKEGYVPCQVTKKMTLNCMDGENGWT